MSSPTQHAARAKATVELFDALVASEADHERSRLRHEIVETNMPVAEAIASRYSNRGVDVDDLRQVAYMGMVKAVAGFDPTYGSDFLQYAVPTVTGEVKRYFRDSGWVVRPPRRIQELQARVSRANNDLSQRLGRAARPTEIAAELEIDLDEVIEALGAYGCFRLASLDLPVGEDESTVGDHIRSDDQDLAHAENRLLLGSAMQALSDRDRRILTLRFGLGWTQERIAQDIGVTQMQVSRLLTRILKDLRGELQVPEPT
ncbi:SigB/SigF/SigG family RNA polymerase sigma factor [Nocardioidaceae bacterium]|nr:SigB/SigF/SigG family RNA polymerase sigma factor [Nocardioidaceae bacterium]